ncbi:hypothetical protein Hanom_Chr10g00913091 [Helianthus anomalus]
MLIRAISACCTHHIILVNKKNGLNRRRKIGAEVTGRSRRKDERWLECVGE